MQTPSYMESEKASRAFREVFCAFHGVREPVVSLETCPHWQALTSAAPELQLVDVRSKTRLINGYFLNTSTPLPKEEALFAIPAGEQCLLPNVRSTADGDRFLQALGFQAIPAGSEAIVHLGSDWQLTMRSAITSKRLAELRRDARRAHEEFELSIQPLQKLDATDLARLEPVFADHEKRYGHQHRIYGERLLQVLKSNSELGPRILIGERRFRGHGIPLATVQAMIWLIGDSSLYYVAQAIRKHWVGPGQNLYKASFFETYDLAARLGFEFVNLGRGSAEAKKNLGAEIFYQQNHWFKKTEEGRVCEP